MVFKTNIEKEGEGKKGSVKVRRGGGGGGRFGGSGSYFHMSNLGAEIRACGM